MSNENYHVWITTTYTNQGKEICKCENCGQNFEGFNYLKPSLGCVENKKYFYLMDSDADYDGYTHSIFKKVGKKEGTCGEFNELIFIADVTEEHAKLICNALNIVDNLTEK